ncbi:hypothetical protein [Mycobacterium scrofulaceum]|uniref:Uncharacterized protein n=1 Tax=Mycobacterium scrofulaceum TaxID=1783 RepID=A0A1X0KEW1_MYCSC|nr:hypothetical protein [Mycobacterium scrofulaceum]ORB73463.1 hypothetical protein BST44_14175 [Mycobacterium scrofulaceum]
MPQRVARARLTDPFSFYRGSAAVIAARPGRCYTYADNSLDDLHQLSAAAAAADIEVAADPAR